MYEKMLVPLDGSKLAQSTLPFAAEIAARLGSEVILAYVGVLTDKLQRDTQLSYKTWLIEATRQEMGRSRDKSYNKEIKVEETILRGNPAKEILRYADQKNIGLIIIAAQGLSNSKLLASRGLAARVLEETNRPILLVKDKTPHHNTLEKRSLKRILVPLDGSKAGEAIIPYVKELAYKLEAEVLLLQIIRWGYQFLVADGYSYAKYLEKDLRLDEVCAKAYLDRVAARLGQMGVTVSSHVSFGIADEDITQITTDMCADLVVLSARERLGIGRWTRRSITEWFLRRSDIPMLIVRVPRLQSSG